MVDSFSSLIYGPNQSQNSLVRPLDVVDKKLRYFYKPKAPPAWPVYKA